MERPPMRLSGPTLDAADPVALAEFYERLLGWTMTDSVPGGWAMVRSPDRRMKIECQLGTAYRTPVWPPVDGEQQMMVHLDIAVEDLDAGVAWAESVGGRLAGHQPRDGVRVMLDPAGHPFCLFRGAV